MAAWWPSYGQAPESLVIYAATSLTDAFEQLAASFAEINHDVQVVLNFASSSTLAAQLMAGAQADVFASANETRMEQVAADGLVSIESVETFARNQLVLAVPAENTAGIESVADLAEGPLLLVLAVTGTPIRDYTDAMLLSYGEDMGDDFVDKVMGNLVSEESNVRQVVTRVALGEADAGIVYQTDVMGAIAEKLITIPINERHNQIAAYPIGLLSDAQNEVMAGRFVKFVMSEAGQAILRQNGFCAPEEFHSTNMAEATPEPGEDIDTPVNGETTACEVEELES